MGLVKIKNPKLYNLWLTVLCRQQGKDEPDASIRTEAFFRSGAGDTPPMT